jgi:hypothetical protein
MSTLLYTLGHRIARHRWTALIAWCLLAARAFAVAGLAGGQLVNDYTIPGTESQRGIDTLAQRFPQASGTTGQVVFTSTSGLIADQQAAVEQQIQAMSKVQHVSSVDDPFASDAVGTISPDKPNAMSSIQLDVPATSLPPEAITQVEAAAQPRPAPRSPSPSAEPCTRPPAWASASPRCSASCSVMGYAAAVGVAVAVLAALLPAALVGVLQAAVVIALVAVSGVSSSSPVGLVGIAVLGAVAFAATNQALVSVFGGVGRMVSLAFVAVQAAAFGGLIPVEKAPAALQTLNGVLPLPQFVAGASRFLLGSGGDVVSPCLVLIGWTVIALLVSVAFAARRRPELAGVARPPSTAGPSTLSLAAEGA